MYFLFLCKGVNAWQTNIKNSQSCCTSDPTNGHGTPRISWWLKKRKEKKKLSMGDHCQNPRPRKEEKLAEPQCLKRCEMKQIERKKKVII